MSLSLSIEFAATLHEAAMTTRREFLQTLGGGFGAVALTDLLAHGESSPAATNFGLYGGVHHPRACGG